MKEELLKVELPQVYKESLFEYQEGLDNAPEWIDLAKIGYTEKQFEKMNILIDIERLKYILKEDIDELTDKEIGYIKELIEKRIEEYNML